MKAHHLALIPALALAVSACASTSGSSAGGGGGGRIDGVFGSVSLQAGFTPDPYRVNVVAGGTYESARELGTQCRGWTTGDGTYVLYYTAGQYPLTISATSDSDTTLIVGLPGGGFLCDDDSGPGLNPQVTINRPGSGGYAIWVATYSSGQAAPAVLSISEVGQR